MPSVMRNELLEITCASSRLYGRPFTDLSGACGHTYGANGSWQVNQPGERTYLFR